MSEFKAHFAYKAMGDGEVSLTEGEVVKVIAQHGMFSVVVSWLQ